jgi:NitT/TauT family transport system substrate-binding protein
MTRPIVSLTRRAALALPTIALPAILLARPARAEASRLRIARQFGLGYAQMSLIEDGRLIEKHAAAAGLGPVEVTWSTFRSSDVMNDALLSGGLDIASLGVPGLLTIADRTAGARFEVRGLCGFNVAPIALVTREPGVRGIADYRPGMKIALPAAKVSNQAIYLQMAAARQWGMAEFTRLDPLTVSMSHPDAVAALLSGGEITSYFGAPPFTQRALKGPEVHEVTNSTAILGKPASFNMLGMPTRFYEGNPLLVRAILAALDEATAAVNADKPAAAAVYARLTNDRTPVTELAEVMGSAMTYTLGSTGTLPIAQFMAAAGVLKRSPAAWTDYVHPSAVSYGGS